MGKYQFAESIENCKNALKHRPDDFLVRAIMCLDYYEIAEAMDVHKQKDEKN